MSGQLRLQFHRYNENGLVLPLMIVPFMQSNLPTSVYSFNETQKRAKISEHPIIYITINIISLDSKHYNYKYNLS